MGEGKAKISGVTPGPIDEATLLAIARIVRACAELEDMVTMFVCKVTGLSKWMVVVLLGKI